VCALGRLFDQTSLSPTERQVVLLTTSSENGCVYYLAAHTRTAGPRGDGRTNHLADTPLDPAFAKATWTRAA